MQIALLVLSIVLIILVAMQEPSDAGLGSLFGGGNADNPSAQRWKSNTKEVKMKKLTRVVIVAIAVLSVVALAIG